MISWLEERILHGGQCFSVIQFRQLIEQVFKDFSRTHVKFSGSDSRQVYIARKALKNIGHALNQPEMVSELQIGEEKTLGLASGFQWACFHENVEN